MASTSSDLHERLWFKKLKGSENYRTWKFDMGALLHSEKLLKIVTGEIEKPQEPDSEPDLDRLEFEQELISSLDGKPNPGERRIDILFDHYKTQWRRYGDWVDKDLQANALIKRYLEENCLSIVRRSLDSRETWRLLEEAFQDPKVGPIFDQFKRAMHLRMDDFKTIPSYTNTIIQLVRELDNRAEINQDLLTSLLLVHHLSPQYHGLIDQVKLMNLSRFDPVSVSKLIHSYPTPRPPRPMSPDPLPTRKRRAPDSPSLPQPSIKKRKCQICNKLGHDESECWFNTGTQNASQIRPRHSERMGRPLEARVEAVDGSSPAIKQELDHLQHHSPAAERP
jgi:hypothetical protein